MRDFYMSFDEWFSKDAQPMTIANKPIKVEMAWGDPITDGQKNYIYGLTKHYPGNMNRRQASDIINAAKDGDMDRALQLLGVEPAAPQPTPEPPPQTPEPTARTPEPPARPQPKPSSGSSQWFLAKAKVDEVLPDHNGDDHKIKEGQYVVLKDNNNEEGTWTYVTVWKGKLQWHNAHIPKADLAGKFDPKPDGKVTKGNKASVLAAGTYEEEQKDFKPTPEQQDIADSFKNNTKDHIMVSARAGTGKTTTLKELAKKYAAGQNWLYLVFNKKNQVEAQSVFGKHVTVRTSNAFGGDVIRDNKKIIPTNQRRMIEIGTGDRLSVMQGRQEDYDQENHLQADYRFFRGLSDKSKKYTMRVKNKFNEIAKEVVSKAKSYGVIPKKGRNDEHDIDMETILQQHMFDTDMEKIKDSINDDDDDRAQINDELTELYQIDNFMSYDFEERIMTAAEWLLTHSMPGAHNQTFEQPSYTGKELRKMFGKDAPDKDELGDKQTMPSWTFKVRALFKNAGQSQPEHNTADFRDFQDDVWFLSQHADELKWPKFDVVLVDEVQDFNRGQRIMLKHLMEAGARIVAVGDEKQGIYRFNGADHESFGSVGKMLEDGSENPENVHKTLTKNWRSKPGIIDHSNKQSIVSDLQAGIEHDEHDQAHISDREHKLDETINRLSTEYNSLGELKKQTAFISRNNAPLIKAAMELMKKAIPFKVEGKDLASETKTMIKEIGDHNNLDNKSSMEEFSKSLESYREYKEEEIAEASKKGKNVGSHIKELKDNTEAIEGAVQLAVSTGSKTLKDFIAFIYARLGGQDDNATEGMITLTTTHKAKGLEFERVYDIAPSLYGANAKIQKAGDLSQMADEQIEAFHQSHDLENLSDEEEADLKKLEKKANNFRIRYEGDAAQEDHAHYVTGTRPMHEFHIVDDTEDEEE